MERDRLPGGRGHGSAWAINRGGDVPRAMCGGRDQEPHEACITKVVETQGAEKNVWNLLTICLCDRCWSAGHQAADLTPASPLFLMP